LREPRSIAVSARTGAGIDDLAELVAVHLPRPAVEVHVLVPYDRGDLVNRVHVTGEVLAEEHVAGGTQLHARVMADLAAELAQFQTAAAR
jgi:GTP-binding protein HflX